MLRLCYIHKTLIWLVFLSPLVVVSLTTNALQMQPKFRGSNLSVGVESTETSSGVTFPTPIRVALLKKAKDLDRNLADGKRLGSYSPNGWSNRVGVALTPAAIPGVYTGDRPFYWNKIDVGCRMCVIQLPNNDLWIHSPVGLDVETKSVLDKLGTVKFVVSPNYEHVSFAEQWSREYPDAFMWGCPGLAEKLPNIKWEGEIPSGLLRANKKDQMENCWPFDIIVPLHLDLE
jgi:hypothetical protein